MNYRHVYHAGNFADLVKHAALLQLVARLTQGPPLTVIDTHAGRGLYDLASPEARKSGEAAAGVVRLMAAPDAPPVFGPLKAATLALNGKGEILRYPGSPWLIARSLRPGDSYLACELRPEEYEALRVALRDRPNARTAEGDGFALAVERCPSQGRVLLLIDPPFERPDDYDRIIATLAAARRRNPRAQALVWLPLKDLETFDAFLRDLEDAELGPAMVVEARIRPLSDPMKMNGCALVLVDGPDLTAAFSAISQWVAQSLGEAGQSRVYPLSSS